MMENGGNAKTFPGNGVGGSPERHGGCNVGTLVPQQKDTPGLRPSSVGTIRAAVCV